MVRTYVYIVLYIVMFNCSRACVGGRVIAANEDNDPERALKKEKRCKKKKKKEKNTNAQGTHAVLV